MSEKLTVYLELDDEEKETGRFEVGDDVEDGEQYLIWETFDTKEEAQTYADKMNAEFARDEKIENEYREWEKSIVSKYNISLDDLRVLLVNGPAGEDAREK